MHHRFAFTLCLSLAAALFSLFSTTVAQAAVLETPVKGKPEIRSINCIGFAPGGVLLIGDGTGSQIFAIETGETAKKTTWAAAKLENVQAKLAERLGTKPTGIEILDLAVNPDSSTAYIAVRKQDDKSYVVLTVDGSGKIGEFVMDDVKYARVKLTAGKAEINNVTDVAWADDRLVAAGRSNETFASKLVVIPAPLKHDVSTAAFSTETYHVAHRQWETKAPMSVVIPYRDGDKTYVVGAFSCTPIVKYPLDALQSGAQVKGTSVVELGSGNRPLDMFVYEKNGKSFVIANTHRFHHAQKPFGPSPYWTVRFEQELLGEATNVNEKALLRLKGNYEPATERIQMIEAYHGVMQMDKLDDAHALVLRETAKGVDLEALPLP